jgi:hypothetical protein
MIGNGGSASEGEMVIDGVLACRALRSWPSDTSTLRPPFGSVRFGDGSPWGLRGGGGYGYEFGDEGTGGSRCGELGDWENPFVLDCSSGPSTAQGNRA